MLMPFVQCFQECLVGSSNGFSFERPVFIVAVGFCLSYRLSFLSGCSSAEVSLIAILLRMPRVDVAKVEGGDSTGLQLSLSLFKVSRAVSPGAFGGSIR